MTTYVAITSGQIDADSPVDTTLTGQWTNNVLAMFEGDASASGVRLQSGALDTGAVFPNIAGATYGAVGTYVLGSGSDISPGSTRSGSSIAPCGVLSRSAFSTNGGTPTNLNTNAGSSGSLSGTWRAMGRIAQASSITVSGGLGGESVTMVAATLWLRIS